MPFPIQIARLARELQRRLGIQGFVSTTLIEDVQPVIPLLTGPEGAFQREELLMAARDTLMSDPLTLARVYLINPAGSGRLAVLEAVTAHHVGATSLSLRIAAATGLGGAGPATARDGRISGTGMVVGNAVHIQSDVVAAGVGPILQMWPSAPGTVREYGSAIILSPNMLCSVSSESVNVTLDVAFVWREFLAAPQEL